MLAIQRPLCNSRIETPDVGSIPAGTGAMNAPGLTGHGVLLGGRKSGAALGISLKIRPLGRPASKQSETSQYVIDVCKSLTYYAT
jgi:hypothetical protein